MPAVNDKTPLRAGYLGHISALAPKYWCCLFLSLAVFLFVGGFALFLGSMLLYLAFMSIHALSQKESRFKPFQDFFDQYTCPQRMSLVLAEKEYVTGVCEIEGARAVMAVSVDKQGILIYRSGSLSYRIGWERIRCLAPDLNEASARPGEPRIYCFIMTANLTAPPICMALPWKRSFQYFVPASLQPMSCP